MTVPKTGGGQNWTTVDMGLFKFPYDSTHAVSLVWDTAGVSVNWWQVQTVAIPDGIYKIVAKQSGDVLGRRGAALEVAPFTNVSGQKWSLHSLGSGHYALHVNGSQVQQWAIIPQADGFCTLTAAVKKLGGSAVSQQEWSFIPVR